MINELRTHLDWREWRNPKGWLVTPETERAQLREKLVSTAELVAGLELHFGPLGASRPVGRNGALDG